MTDDNTVRPSDPHPEGETSLHVRAAKKGDPESREWLVRRFSPFLLSQAKYRIRNMPHSAGFEPEDIVNDTFLIAFNRLPDLSSAQGRHTPPLVRFLGGIVLNKSQEYLRRSIKQNLWSDGELSNFPSPLGSPFKDLVLEESRGEIFKTLQSLGELDQRLVILRWLEGQPIRVIAELVDLSPNNVSQRIRRAIEKIRCLVDDELISEFE